LNKINLMKPFLFCLFVTAVSTCFSQTYNVTVDTVNLTSYSFETELSIEEDPSDSLTYEISFYSIYSSDSVLMFEEVFEINSPKIESFSKVDFDPDNNTTYLTLLEADQSPYVVFVKVLQSGTLIEELTFE